MPRRARLAIAGIPWHILQRGNNRSACFYHEEDYLFYLEQLALQAMKCGCIVHAYCLMTNHVHLLVTPVIVHSDQGCQYTSYDWSSMLKQHNLVPSMSRRGNCHDNAVAESFFPLLKRERIRRKVYASRDEGKQDVFYYIELFYNPVRRHGNNQNLSPVQYEKNYFMKLQSV